MWYKNICSASFSFVTIHACDRPTDRRTDRQTDRITTPKTAVAYARAVKIGPLKQVAITSSKWARYEDRTLRHVNCRLIGFEIETLDMHGSNATYMVSMASTGP